VSASQTTSSTTVAQMFGRDAAYMMLWAVQLLGAALCTPLITRALGLAEFGAVTTANAVMQVLFIVAGLGLQPAVQRAYAGMGGPAAARRLVTVVLAAAAGVSALAWISLSWWSGPLTMAGQRDVLRLAVVWAGLSAATAATLALLRSQDRLAAFAVVSLLQSIVAEVVSLGLVQLRNGGAADFLAGQVAAQTVALLLGLFLVRPLPIGGRDRPLVADALRFALPLVPSILSTFVLSTSDRFIVEASLGSDAVARYQVAYNVAAMPMLLLSVLSAAWMPRFFRLSDVGERRVVLAASRDALYRLLIPVMVGFAAATPLVLRLWAPPSYRPETLQLVACLVLATTVPFAAQLAVTRALMAAGHTRAIAAANIAAAAANIAGNLLLVPVWGLAGSALATLGAYLLLHAVLATAARSSQVAGPLPGLRAGLAAATAVTVLFAVVPQTGLVLAARGVLTLAAIGWFLHQLTEISNPGRSGRLLARLTGADDRGSR